MLQGRALLKLPTKKERSAVEALEAALEVSCRRGCSSALSCYNRTTHAHKKLAGRHASLQHAGWAAGFRPSWLMAMTHTLERE